MRKVSYVLVLVFLIILAACSKNSENEKIDTISAFIEEFFTPNLNSRLTTFENSFEKTVDNDELEASAFAYHEGIKPYLTQSALEKIMNNRTLYVYDQEVVSSGGSEINDINIKEVSSDEGIYTFVVTVITESSLLEFEGQITLDLSQDTPLISNLYFPFPS